MFTGSWFWGDGRAVKGSPMETFYTDCFDTAISMAEKQYRLRASHKARHFAILKGEDNKEAKMLVLTEEKRGKSD